jgi:hypothetical protein
MSSESRTLKPLPLPLALLYFGIPAVFFVICVYFLIPLFMQQGMTEFMSYSLSLLIPLILMLIASLVALKLEGYPITWHSIKERFRLRKMDRTDWLWVAVNGLSLLPIIAVVLR